MLAVADAPDSDRWDLNFPHRLSSPTTVGAIRQHPEDFQVVEDLGFSLSGEGEHICFDIEKREANTAWVAWQLAEFLGLKDADIGYAGRKDRHAVTRQWFSATMPGQPLPDMAGLNIEGATLHGVKRHRQKLRPGLLAGNRFHLRVVLDQLDDRKQRDLEARLESLREMGFPNYFGPQRFGHNGANLDLAEQLLTRLLTRKGKLKGDRGMAISAARSWLFNRYLGEEISLGANINDRSGELIGKSRDPQPGEADLDSTMQAWVAGLRRLGAKVETRPLVVLPKEMGWSFEADALMLEFSLPAGAYATSLLREVIIVQDTRSGVAS